MSENSEQDCEDFQSNYENRINDFQQMGLIPQIQQGLVNFGINEPTEIQELSIMPIILAQNVIAKSPFRYNQMISFVIGILQRIIIGIEDNQRALVVTPTDTQAIKIYNLFKEISTFIPELNITKLNNEKTIDQRIDEINQSQILISEYKYAIAHAQNENIVFNNINIICISDSDQLFSGELYTNTKEIISNLQPDLQIIAFTTTITNDILDNIEAIIKNPVKICVNNEPIKIKNVREFYVEPISGKYQFKQLFDLCSKFHPEEVLVIAQSKKSAEYFHKRFQESNFDFPLIHHEMENEEQKEIMNQFDVKKRGVLISDFLPKIDSQKVIVIFVNMPYKMPVIYANHIILGGTKDSPNHKIIKRLPQEYIHYFSDYDKPRLPSFKHFYIYSNNQQ